MNSLAQLLILLLCILFGMFIHILYSFFTIPAKKHFMVYDLLFWLIISFTFIEFFEKLNVSFRMIFFLFMAYGYYISYTYLKHQIERTITPFHYYLHKIIKVFLAFLKKISTPPPFILFNKKLKKYCYIITHYKYYIRHHKSNKELF